MVYELHQLGMRKEDNRETFRAPEGTQQEDSEVVTGHGYLATHCRGPKQLSPDGGEGCFEYEVAHDHQARHSVVLNIDNPEEILEEALRFFPVGGRPAFQGPERQITLRHKADFQKALPPVPQQLSGQRWRSQETFGPPSQEYGSRPGVNPEQKFGLNQRLSSAQNESGFHTMTVAQRPDLFKKLLSPFKMFLAIYGNDRIDGEPIQTINDTTVSYPHGFTFFLVLLSGALPYVVVSFLSHVMPLT
jgi:hypothetical protein